VGFALPLALLLGLFTALVVLAHALRKGQATPVVFPAARLVLETPAAARSRRRIEDRWLLLSRALLVGALALLAASPFVSCDRLTLARNQGASLSATLIIDDSASMQATTESKSRLSRALDAARQLVADAHPGDAFAIVLAGAPARVLLPSTVDFGSVREALDNIVPTDRGTDLHGGLALARGLAAQAPQSDQPILLLSDLSGGGLDSLDLSGVTLPSVGLTAPLSNCALINASFAEQGVLVETVCTDASALLERTLHIENAQGLALGPKVTARDGVQSLALSQPLDPSSKGSVVVVLSGSINDQIESDDRSVALLAPTKLSVALRADLSKAGVKTSSDTVLQSGLEALERNIFVQPLSLLPDEPAEIAGYAALLVDDPSGFPPEARNAIQSWVMRGGVAVVFLGPGIGRTPLGSNFLPFLDTMPSWSTQVVAGTSSDPGALGPLTPTWSDLNAKGRATFAVPSDLQVLAAFSDAVPLIASKPLGQGLLILSSLPSSVDVSDFVLRPAYLELLDHIVTQASVRLGSAATPVGQRFAIPKGATVKTQDGRALTPLTNALDLRNADAASIPSSDEWLVEPDSAGAYLISHDGEQVTRYAIRIPAEHIAQPHGNLATTQAQARAHGQSKVGISRELSLVVLVLSVIELLLRALRREKSAPLRQNLLPRAT